MKTTLPNQITSKLEAKKYLSDLAKNDELYHPDDPAEDIIDRNRQRLFSDEEAPKMDALMKQVFEHLPDPYGYGLNLMIKFNKDGITAPFEITGKFREEHDVVKFTPDWYESDDAEEWFQANWENVEDMLNDPYNGIDL